MAARYDLNVNQGNSFALNVTMLDSAGAPLDLTGSTFLGILHVFGNESVPVATFTVAAGANPNDRTLSLTATQTAALFAGSYSWELQYTDAAGEPWDLLRGRALVSGTQQGAAVQNADITVTSTTVTVEATLPGTQGPSGPQGPTGPQGATGAAGQGVPVGGTDGQVLTKASAADYDAAWEAPTGGGDPATTVESETGFGQGSAVGTSAPYARGDHTHGTPALGTSGTTAAAGNDARLSDARTPTAHAASHDSGGGDAVSPASIGAATSAQGSKADTAVQPGDDAATLGSGAAGDGHVLTADGAGGAVYEAPASGTNVGGLVFFGDDPNTARPSVDGPVHWLGYDGTIPVNAVEDAGNGAYFDLVTTVDSVTVPDAPTIGTATAGDGQATVPFTAPADDGGEAITSYTVTSSPGGLTASGASSPLTVEGLTNDTPYTFTVVATNSVGDSDPSAASNEVTPEAAATAPDAPTGLAATGADGEVSLAWTPSSGATSHDVYRNTADSFAGATKLTTSLGGSADSYTDSTVANDTEYFYWITATNAVGESNESTSDSATPTAAAAGTFFTDFSGYTTGAQPSDWTRRYEADATWSVEDVVGATGDKVLRYTAAGSSGRNVLSWDAIDGDADRDDVEMLARFRVTANTPGGIATTSLSARGQGAAASESTYLGGLRGDATLERRITSYVAGTPSTHADEAFSWAEDVWYWARFRVNGASLEYTIWTGAVEDEPATVDLSATNSDVSGVGHVGLFGFQTGVVVEFDYFAAATGGATAPGPA